MKIRKLQLKNIGVFDEEAIEFKECPAKDKAEIHILTGENGTGKSTILQALSVLFGMSIVNSYGETNDKILDAAFEVSKNGLSKKLRHFSEALVGFNVEHHSENRSYSWGVNILGDFGRSFSPFEIDKTNIIDKSLVNYSFCVNANRMANQSQKLNAELLDFAVFAYSGYRRIKDEPIEIGKNNEEHPLHQSLNFIKDENSKFNVSQWLGENLLNSSLAETRNKKVEAEKLREKVKHLENVINKIIADETNDNLIKFEMQSATKLILIKNNQELDFDVLPDGLKSLMSWIGDLLMRLDSLKWKEDIPIFEREIFLFLDEIEVHLHPAWQRKVLPVIQHLFKNAQIFVSTHSPFVVNSVDDAWVYKLKVKNGRAHCEESILSEDGYSYQTVLSEIFGIDEEFGLETQKDLDKFYSIVRKGKDINEKELKRLAKSLAKQSEELNTIVQIELRQLNRKRGTNFTI